MTKRELTNGNRTLKPQSLALLPPTAAHDTAFVGRRRELAAIERCFTELNCRLLSLVGLGGVGKTRIAWEAGAGMADHFAHGCFFVSLAAIVTPDLIVPTIAAAISFTFQGGEPPQIQLIRHLSSRDMLLILDNFEHLINGGADLIAEILQAAPGVRLLITSRERLNLREEWVIDVHGLDYPVDNMDAENFSAVQLFLQHARRVKGDFQLTDANRADVVRICRLVEGMPLALELAAVWVRALSCRAIGDEIARSLDFLTTNLRDMPEKHRSMRAVFAHSYRMLTVDQQQVFAKLSVFRGGFEREAAEAIAGASLTILAEFVDKSLLSVSNDGRYDIHELLRQYGEEQLETVGDDVRDAHSAYYANFLNQRVEDVKGRRQVAALTEIRADFENIRTAWNWSVSHKYADSINQMIEGLWLFCRLCNRVSEGTALFQEAETQFVSARQLWGRLLGRGTTSLEQVETALEVAREFDDLKEIAFSLKWAGYMAYYDQQYARTISLLEQSLAIYRRLGDRYDVAQVLFDLMTFDFDGSWDNFKDYGEESLRIRREIGDRIGTAWSIMPVAHGHVRVGEFAEAERLLRERIAIGFETGALDLAALGNAHASYAVYFFQGDFARAREAADAALKITPEISGSHLTNAAGWSLITLGLLANMDEHYREGMRLCQEAAASTPYRYIKDFAAWGSCLASCGMGDNSAAIQLYPQALKYCMKMHGLVGIIACMPPAALILAHRGRSTRAVELLALAFTHPVRAAGWMEKWPLLARLRDELEQALGAAAYLAAWERGTQLDLETTAAELQARFTAKASASQPLEDTLTERELEVLRLLAAGLSNQDIADRLVITLGTVKSHINNIYGKLGVNNRVQAIVEAKKLGLLQ